jgi:signal transduction histidine kinase
MESDPRLALAELVLLRLPEPVHVLDASGKIVEANRAARKRADIEQLFADDVRDVFLGELLDDLRTHGVAAVELSLAAGTIRLEATALEGWFVVIVRDVSERREVDEELRLLRSGASLALVAATLVHDFNNVLTPVLLLSSRLERELGKESREAMMASEIHSAAKLGASLMRDVLALSRPRTHLIERVDVNDVVVERLGLIGRLLGEFVEVESVLDDRVGDVLVDRKRFEHALLNLVANARDAMPGGGRLRIATKLVEGDEPSVTLSVGDTGVGMTDDVRRRAFDNFFTTRGDSGGTGIGLASVHRFARESGGRVTLESEPMVGTTVTLFLPRLASSRPAPRVAEEPIFPSSGNAKVLIAEGSAAVSNAIRAALEARGYGVIVASSADGALDTAAAERPDIVLVDSQLGHHDPRTFLHRLRAAAGPVPIVFLSVPPESGSRAELGVHFLPKAFSDDELFRALGEALATPAAPA